MIQPQVTTMRANLKPTLALLVLFTLPVTLSAAEPNAVAESIGSSSFETKSAAPAAQNSNQTKAVEAAQSPTLDDAALKAPALGTAFEAFQPSEAISADNAVPFPTNI